MSKRQRKQLPSPNRSCLDRFSFLVKIVLIVVAFKSYKLYINLKLSLHTLGSNNYSTKTWEWSSHNQYNFSDVELLPGELPNPKFIFHNKLPKCGSTVMNDIVKLLAKQNGFTYTKMDAEKMGFDEQKKLVVWLKQNYNESFFLMQHHYIK